MMPRFKPPRRRRPPANRGKKRFELKQGDNLSKEQAPWTTGRSIRIEATIKPSAPNGVILAQGGQGQGYALYVKDGRAAMAARLGGRVTEVIAPDKLPGGEVAVAGHLAKDGTLSVFVAGKKVASGKGPGTIPMPGDGLQVGADLISAAGNYESPNKFKGTIKKVILTLAD